MTGSEDARAGVGDEAAWAVADAMAAPGLGMARVVEAVFDEYADRPALADRATRLRTDVVTGRISLELLPEFNAITYGALRARVLALAAGWHHVPADPIRAGDFVCTLGFVSSDYVTVELACVRLGLVSVPLHATASTAMHRAIIAETDPRVLAVSIESLDEAVELALGSTSVEHVLVFGYREEVDDQREVFEAARLRLDGSAVVLDSLTAFVERARTLPAPPLPDDPSGETLGAVIYTSGSTGSPKGAMVPQRALVALLRNSLIGLSKPVVILNFLPLSHMGGLFALYNVFGQGGLTCFPAKSDLSTLLEDLSLARVSTLLLVPRVAELLYQHYRREVSKRGTASEEQLKTELREGLMGGRVREVTSFSAPLSAEIKAFLESSLQVTVNDLYASTEAGAVNWNGRPLRPPVLDYKLADVPELGYFTTDSPYPRGELRLKTETIIAGYHQRPDVTAEVFDEEGFYKTGDVMAEVGTDQLVYVDRTKNVLKLSQGEFVALARLESIFVTAPPIRQIHLYGSSERSYLVAVIVPTPEAFAEFGAVLHSVLHEALQRIARESELDSYEVPRDFLIETEPFTAGNGLMTPSGKQVRPQLDARYGPALEQMYVRHAEELSGELQSLLEAGRRLPVLETVSRAARSLLGSSSAELSPEAHFTDLGGDSLSALSFSELLQEIYDVEVPVSVVTSPATDLRQLAAYIEARLDSGRTQPSFATVHGSDAIEVGASDLTLDKFIDTATLARTTSVSHTATGEPRTVLLTGANGYLGRFVCLEWLERVAETGGKLICIVRGSTAGAARDRLAAAFDTGDPELTRRYRDLAEGSLEVLAGDLGAPNLGLEARTWARLADTIDLIVHAGALVNHVLPYHQLFGPNVVGTAEVIRLATRGRMKPVNYLSTVAVGTQIVVPSLDEDSDIRVVSPVRRIDETYANGYGTSKWAGEVLLREAHDLCGLPVTVFRSDMILAHSRYRGQLNVPDMFTRLLLSLVATGIAPDSFYQRENSEERPLAHYDGLPVDFTAEAIATLSEQALTGFRTFNVVNPHDDAISLDVFVDWLNDAGKRVRRIGPYERWLDRFETVIRGLPEIQRQHSLLPLLEAFREPEHPRSGSLLPGDRFRQAVREAKIGPDHDVPHLSASLISKYLADLTHLGLL